MIKNFLLLTTIVFGSTLFAQGNTVFQEDFSPEGDRGLWTIGELDGDGYTWDFFDNADPFGACALSLSSIFFSPMFADNTLISPAIDLPTGVNLDLSFKVANVNLDLGIEHYAVYVIPANATFVGNEIAVFEETLDADYSSVPKTINVSISEFAGKKVQLVFRHYKTNYQESMMLKLDDVVIEKSTLGVSDINNKNVSIYPNPTFDVVTIKGLDKVEKVKVYDLTGKLVKEFVGNQTNISTLPKGVYLLNIHSDNQVFTRKIVKK